MRQAPTAQEARLWDALRARQLGGFKFRRQLPIGPYVVDFVCLQQRLIVEADGPFHFDDGDRDAWFAEAGYRVLRFTNQQIATNLEGVLTSILAKASPRRSFSPCGRRWPLGEGSDEGTP
ncbi:endonuclease domain-containing protein [Phenylobacterium aquaticum]|nr:endonuclease domain-containing protein [Phenylobacterium aquaticum]